jgi:hypothetical protein
MASPACEARTVTVLVAVRVTLVPSESAACPENDAEANRQARGSGRAEGERRVTEYLVRERAKRDGLGQLGIDGQEGADGSGDYEKDLCSE